MIKEFQQVCLAVKNEANRVLGLVSNPRQETQEVKVTRAHPNVDESENSHINISDSKHYLEFIRNIKGFQDSKQRILMEEKFANQGKKLTDAKEYKGCDLTEQVELDRLVSKIRHNLGSYHWETMGKRLRRKGVPKLFYEGVKKHMSACERRQINGARPLSTPAKFPMG